MCSVHPPAGFHPPRHGSAGWESRLCGSREGAWSLCKWVFLPIFPAPKAGSPSTAVWPGATWAPVGVLGSDCDCLPHLRVSYLRSEFRGAFKRQSRKVKGAHL